MPAPDNAAPPGASPAPARPGAGARLYGAFQRSTSLKLVLLAGAAAAVLLVAVGIFGSSPAPPPAAPIRPTLPPPSKPGLPGSPELNDQIKIYEQERADTARATDGSNVNTPTVVAPVAPAPATPDLARYAKVQTEATAQAQNAPQQPQRKSELQGLMEKQLAALEMRWGPSRPETILDARPDAAAPAATGTKSSADQSKKPSAILEHAGKLRYGETRFGTSSDTNAPVFVDLRQGPFSGGTITGSYELSGESFVLKFTKLDYQDHSYKINAIAVDPDTESYPVVDDVDHKYFDRIILPAAAAFISGFGTAAARPPTTIAVNGASTVTESTALTARQELLAGAGAAANQAGQIINQDAAKLRPTSTLYAHRAVGIYFIDNITEADALGSDRDSPDRETKP